ncbi:hypothetical protein JHK82_053140 [Glycine max]|uniref:Uncharacterized protein n=1 Tax=Glycine soja TaxID=3848 RepID=A0A0B2Q6W4_GLYSO|nr:hypothetical protein JHK86_052988 [Glycine max]KAG4915499.1 hypothetical protein JHK87_053056 [Glycine soja]KAG4927360.1 hypothetical protein JHK85_053846 [Glycine max]KAG5082977.1 hypothetical protein JHK84_053015 [Glycine max]KAG5085743.1 hypothetical protein JHK82_053140 [Glycine max]
MGQAWQPLQRGGGCELKELVNERYDLLGHEVKKVVEGKDKNRVIESSSDFVDVMLDLEKENRL